MERKVRLKFPEAPKLTNALFNSQQLIGIIRNFKQQGLKILAYLKNKF